jgi:hypothetical protein
MSSPLSESARSAANAVASDMVGGEAPAESVRYSPAPDPKPGHGTVTMPVQQVAAPMPSDADIDSWMWGARDILKQQAQRGRPQVQPQAQEKPKTRAEYLRSLNPEQRAAWRQAMKDADNELDSGSAYLFSSPAEQQQFDAEGNAAIQEADQEAADYETARDVARQEYEAKLNAIEGAEQMGTSPWES